MKIIADATAFTAPEEGPNHWVERFRAGDLSVGTYSIPAGGLDDQTPHSEDEIYVVIRGRARLETGSGTADVQPGSVIHVPAGESHIFADIAEDLTLLVIFAPPYGSRRAGQPGLVQDSGRPAR